MKRNRNREFSFKSIITLLLPDIFQGMGAYVNERRIEVYQNDKLVKEIWAGNFRTVELKVSSNEIITVKGFYKESIDFEWSYKIGTEAQKLLIPEDEITFPVHFFDRLNNQIRVSSHYDFTFLKKKIKKK